MPEITKKQAGKNVLLYIEAYYYEFAANDFIAAKEREKSQFSIHTNLIGYFLSAN